MAHFYGTLQGSRGQATRCGTKASGMTAVAASWEGAVRADVHATNRATAQMIPWHGKGQSIALYDGEASGEFDVWVRAKGGDTFTWEKRYTVVTREGAEGWAKRHENDKAPVVIVPAGCYFKGF